MSSPPILESEWVPLTNTFSENLAKRDQQDEQDFTFTVSRGTSDTHLMMCFSGVGEGVRSEASDVVRSEAGEGCELSEEISFDKLVTLHG